MHNQFVVVHIHARLCLETEKIETDIKLMLKKKKEMTKKK